MGVFVGQSDEAVYHAHEELHLLHLESIHGVVSLISLRCHVSVSHCTTFYHTTFSIYGKPLPIASLINCPQLSSMLGIYYLMFATFAGKLPRSHRYD